MRHHVPPCATSQQWPPLPNSREMLSWLPMNTYKYCNRNLSTMVTSVQQPPLYNGHEILSRWWLFCGGLKVYGCGFLPKIYVQWLFSVCLSLSLLQGEWWCVVVGRGEWSPCRHHQHWQESGVSQGTFGFPVAAVGWIVMLSYLENLSAWKKDWNPSKNE